MNPYTMTSINEHAGSSPSGLLHPYVQIQQDMAMTPEEASRVRKIDQICLLAGGLLSMLVSGIATIALIMFNHMDDSVCSTHFSIIILWSVIVPMFACEFFMMGLAMRHWKYVGGVYFSLPLVGVACITVWLFWINLVVLVKNGDDGSSINKEFIVASDSYTQCKTYYRQFMACGVIIALIMLCQFLVVLYRRLWFYAEQVATYGCCWVMF